MSFLDVFADEKNNKKMTAEQFNEILDKRRAYFTKLAEEGNIDAIKYLAMQSSMFGNYEEGHKWILKAALHGDADSQNELAQMYSRGRGVEKDQIKATEWYIKAAENGYGGSYIVLANRYLAGEGIERNCEKAVYWYKKTAQSNWSREIGLDYLIKLYSKGHCVSQSWQTVYKYYLIYNKVALHGKNYQKMEKLVAKLNKEEVSLAEKQADEWLRTNEPTKRF